MSGYIGVVPLPQATQTRDVFTATSGQTSFATSGYTPNFLDVWLNGVKLVNGDDFTATNGSDVVLTSGATTGDTVEVLSYSTYEVNAQTYTGGLTVNNDAATVLTVDRATSDGTLVDFKKDGTTVGSVGSRVGLVSSIVLDPRTGGAGLTSGGNTIAATDQTGSITNGSIDLGAGAFRWKDLYLSGGVYLGGTTSSNYLDDYEFGSWTPTLARSVSDPTVTYTVRNGYYYKVGNVVFLRANIVASSVSGGSGSPEITGLPFTPNHTYSYGYSNHGVSSMSYGLLSTTGGYPPVMFARGDSSTRITVVDSNAQGLTGWDASGRLDFAITYTTNS